MKGAGRLNTGFEAILSESFGFSGFFYRRFEKRVGFGVCRLFVCLLLLVCLFLNGDANRIWVAVGSDSWCVQRLGLGKRHVEHLGTYGDHHHCNIATGPTPFSRTKQTSFANMVSVVFRPL